MNAARFLPMNTVVTGGVLEYDAAAHGTGIASRVGHEAASGPMSGIKMLIK